MIIEPRRRKSSSVTFSVPDDHLHAPYYTHRTASFAESEWDYEPTITSINPTALAMARALRSVKTFKKSWDADKALKSTYQGKKFGRYQLRAYIFLALGYAIVVAWLAEMPTFALLPPKTKDCSRPLFTNTSDQVVYETSTKARIVNPNIASPIKKPRNSTILKLNTNNGTNTLVNSFASDTKRVLVKDELQVFHARYNFTTDYGRTVPTDFNVFCDTLKMKLPYIFYLVGLVLGGLVFGYIADHSGRKMILLGSMWTACALSVFQLLSEDYISYVFFILFVGVAIGAVQVITVPYVLEMFPIESRAIYGLSLTAAVFLFDLIIPGLAFLIQNWKTLQGVVTFPLIITAVLYWFSEESMFWYTTQKDYVTAVLSLTKIARFNGVNFENVFGEARDFLRGKRSKGVQCDFQPLLRLEDIQLLGSKYPDFDMVDLQTTGGKKSTFSERFVQVLTGHHYYPTLSTFYPTDFLHSSILTIYLLIMCGLWLVSSLTEYSLDSPHIIQHLPENFFLNYFYSHLIQIASLIVAFPLVYKWGRRWPTFCFFLIAEVCLLGSVTVRADTGETRLAMLIVYFIGKFASRGAFIVILLYTCEIFPTGLRCTTLGICYMFRLIGVALASEEIAGLNDTMPRLVYGILSLVLGAMALLLPETKKFPLPRTIVQVEMIPTSVSKKFRRHRSLPLKRNAKPDGTRTENLHNFNDAASSVSGVRSVRFGGYDNQSTLHSVYELQEYGQDDTLHSLTGRYPRRTDSRNPNLFQPSNIEAYRQQTTIAEDGEYDDDVDDDRTRYAQQQRLSEKQMANLRSDTDVVILPNKQPTNEPTTQLEMTAQIQSGNINNELNDSLDTPSINGEINDKAKTDDNISTTQNLTETNAFPPNISEEENYFSEHC